MSRKQIQYPFPPGHAWLPILAGVFLLLPAGEVAGRRLGQQDTTEKQQVSFRTAVLPILQRQCFECHSVGNVKGDLRLDLESEALKGGHSGNMILGNDPEQSELFLRITSSEDGYRMPKEGDPLSETEIALFRTWIEQGSRWGAVARQEQTVRRESSTIELLADLWNDTNAALRQPRYRYAAVVAIPVVILLLFFVYSFRQRRRAKKNPGSAPSWSARARISHFVLLLLALFAAAIVLYQYGLVEELQAANENLARKLNDRTGKIEVSDDPDNITLPPYPMHPKRLGGIYYRGNDERSPHLFNGGFYRTATLEIWLVNSSGQRFHWNDEVTDQPMFISLTIKRAPGTTRSLFSDRVINTTYLRHFPQSPDRADETNSNAPDRADLGEISLNEKVSGEAWQARVPIDAPANWQNQTTEGVIYVYYGAQMIKGRKGRVHFGIRYNIELEAGKISSNSEIWMGSLYNLSGRVLVPGKDTILLDRWFDFRPIPEIEGQNTSDPKLLGIPEHVK